MTINQLQYKPTYCTTIDAYGLNGGDFMAKTKTNEEYTCTVVFTEGSEQRITEALVELYYNRQRGITKTDDKAGDQTV